MKVAFVLLLAFLAVALATPYGRMRPVKTVPSWVEYEASRLLLLLLAPSSSALLPSLNFPPYYTQHRS
jgi:hypothetical protein